ncbi:hypothetical protein OsJ_12543 [Oryza sativa Japonica Group]|uniref:Uncharacterized protein n=1 Tax=Oryza sativa subsp. japonica TaxID=39947 RepID=B9FBS4_ORYSJ|nr:hypothetical protein OsJ_12543 [Oryza sativa Japonica Group]
MAGGMATGPGSRVTREPLKESLSDVLSQYPAMTGRLKGPAAAAAGGGGEGGEGGGATAAVHHGWIVKCNDAGVRTVDATAAATLDEWLATASGEEEMDLAYFEPMGPDPYIWSPFYVQLTEFADKSYALGLSCTHLHNDPTAAVLFLNAWAAAHRRDSPYPPFLHSPALAAKSAAPPPEHPLLAAKSRGSPDTGGEMSSATFRFSAAAMRALLSAVEPGTTPFAALAALFWLRVAAAAADAAAGGGAAQERDLTLALDFRKRMQAPLPTGYYGTAVHFATARADLSSGLASVSAAAAGGEPFQMYGPELTCMALDHVPLYGAEFAAGAAPARAACRVGGASGEGLVIVLPSAEGESARDVAVTLPAAVTARICRDGEVLRYGADVVFGPKVDTQAS